MLGIGLQIYLNEATDTLAGALPVASFTISNATPSVGQTVTFTDTSTGTPTSWSWAVSGGAFSFVNGTSATSQNPQIQFNDSSTSYTVNLTASNADGSDSTNFINNITTASVQIPVASFTISDATPNVGQIVTFTDTSTESPTSWSWAISPSTYVFEGGTSATSQNPQIAFLDESENYTVNLTATNAGGSDSTSFTNNVVSNALEAVHFEYDPYLYLDADNEGTQVPTTYGSPTYNSAGYYAFDGTDDAFYYDYDGGINDATGAIEVFIDWDNTQNGIAIGWARDNASSYRGHILLSQTDNVIRVFIRGAASTNQIVLDWNFAGTSGKYHIVLNKTADGGSSPSYNYEMYINGVSQGNADADNSTATQGLWFNDQDGFTPYNITVGGLFANSVTLPSNEIIGDIYRATIYQDALSATRISENYNWLSQRSYDFGLAHFEYDPYLYGDADNKGMQVPTTYGSPTYNSAGYYDFVPTVSNNDGFTYDTPNGVNDTDGSIELWCQADQIIDNNIIFTGSQGSTDDFRFQVGKFGANAVFYIKGASGSVFGRIENTSSFVAGEWIHIVVTRKSGVPLYSTASLAFDCYINGTLVTTAISKTGSGYWLEYIDGRTPWNFSVGGYNLNNNNKVTGGWDGKIGRGAVYQTPLTAAKISENYNKLLER